MEIEKRDEDHWYVAVALAAAGRGPELRRVLDRLYILGFTPEQFYEDEDLGKALRGEALGDVRKVFPE